MMLFVKVSLTLFLATTQAQTEDSCSWAFANDPRAGGFAALDNRQLRTQITDYRLSTFQTYKRDYQQRLKTNREIPSLEWSQSTESKLAYIEVLTEKEFSSPTRDWTVEQWQTSDQLTKKFLQFDPDKKTVSSWGLTHLLENLYLINHHQKSTIGALFAVSKRSRAFIQQRIEVALAHQDLVSALKEIGILRDPTRLEAFQTWFSKNGAVYFDLAIATTLNFLTYKGVFQSIGAFGEMSLFQKILVRYPWIPTSSMKNWVKLTPEVLTLARTQGIEKAIQRLIETQRLRYGMVKTAVVAKAIDKIYGLAVAGMLAYFVYENWTNFSFYLQFANVSQEELKKHEDAKSDYQLRREYIARDSTARTMFPADDGHIWDPQTDSEDSLEYVQFVQSAMAMPIENLRIYDGK